MRHLALTTSAYSLVMRNSEVHGHRLPCGAWRQAEPAMPCGYARSWQAVWRQGECGLATRCGGARDAGGHWERELALREVHCQCCSWTERWLQLGTRKEAAPEGYSLPARRRLVCLVGCKLELRYLSSLQHTPRCLAR